MSKTNPKLFAMCAEGKFDYTRKWLCGCGAIMVLIIIILAVVISYSGGAGNSVEMQGNGDSALVEESSGLHLLEINESGKCDTAGAGWNWMEVALVVIGFKFVLVMTHIFHYCWAKKLVKQKVRRNVDIEMAKLDMAPQAEKGVIVPALV